MHCLNTIQRAGSSCQGAAFLPCWGVRPPAAPPARKQHSPPQSPTPLVAHTHTQAAHSHSHSPASPASTSAVTTLASEYLPLMVTPPSSPMDTCRAEVMWAGGWACGCACQCACVGVRLCAGGSCSCSTGAGQLRRSARHCPHARIHSKQAIALCSPAGGQQQQHVLTVSFSPFMVVSSWPSDRSEEYAWMSGITW